MEKQKEREQRILSKINFDRLPFKVEQESWKKLGSNISAFIHQVFKPVIMHNQSYLILTELFFSI